MKLSKLITGMVVLAVASVAAWFWTPNSRVGSPLTDSSGRIDIAVLERDGGQYGILGDIDSGMLSGLSSPSLKMKENVDFFLTPALLVQECISENVIITYPGE